MPTSGRYFFLALEDFKKRVEQTGHILKIMIEKRGFMREILTPHIFHGKDRDAQKPEKVHSGSKGEHQKGNCRPYKTARADHTID